VVADMMSIKYRAGDRQYIVYGDEEMGGSFDNETAAELLTKQAAEIEKLRKELERIDLERACYVRRTNKGD